ncbi:hypothetical protein [Streptomyces venezuelae]|uniref:hypothetical protein n=1 Tax=Streptomyces venezuelae TaxID=54571 RepID=UPI0036614E6C
MASRPGVQPACPVQIPQAQLPRTAPLEAPRRALPNGRAPGRRTRRRNPTALAPPP